MKARTREEVVEALETCVKDDRYECRKHCPYNENGFNCYIFMHRDALKYLKEEKKDESNV